MIPWGGGVMGGCTESHLERFAPGKRRWRSLALVEDGRDALRRALRGA